MLSTCDGVWGCLAFLVGGAIDRQQCEKLPERTNCEWGAFSHFNMFINTVGGELS